MLRRDLLKAWGALGGLSLHSKIARALPSWSPNQEPLNQSQSILPLAIERGNAVTGVPILQGMTDQNQAQFTLIQNAHQNISVRAISQSTGLISEPAKIALHRRDFSLQAVLRFQFTDLQLTEHYHLEVLHNDRIIDRREFGLLDLNKSQARCAFVSCMFDQYHQESIWAQLIQTNPDLIFFIGDSVYADFDGLIPGPEADEKQLWKRFVQTRKKLAFYYSKTLIPVLAVWDDHDYGHNNADGTYIHKDISRINFETFFAQEECTSLQRGPGVASRLQAFGQDFFLLDGRSFRSPKESKNLKSGIQNTKTFFGVDQQNWFFDRIGERPAWVISGTQFFGNYQSKDSFEGEAYAEDFSQFVQRLQKASAPFLFVSGDMHYTEIMDIEPEIFGFPTMEITSSSMHSMAVPGGYLFLGANPRRRNVTSKYNFCLVEVSAEVSAEIQRLQGQVHVIGTGGEIFVEPLMVERGY